jgi:hypothetical protein
LRAVKAAAIALVSFFLVARMPPAVAFAG